MGGPGVWVTKLRATARLLSAASDPLSGLLRIVPTRKCQLGTVTNKRNPTG